VPKRRVKETFETYEKGPLGKLLTPAALKLLTGSGAELIRQIGLDVVREIVFDILTGKNVRDSTEILTRSRITALNLATATIFFEGAATTPDFVSQLPYLAAETLTRPGLTKPERWLAQWILGLTDKAFQNVLKDDKTLIDSYRNRYVEACSEIINNYEQEYGALAGTVKIVQGGEDGRETPVDWLLITYLLNTIGSQTLTIRGSDKSTNGKLFEKLVLGSLLSILGFTYEATQKIGERVFWLSSQSEKRESDATLLYTIGQGIRFDIGFIGRGNPEIVLDKVTRFDHIDMLGNDHFYMATIIIVDRIGKDTRIVNMARAIGGEVVQMSNAYWPKDIAVLLHRTLGFEHELLYMEQGEIETFLKAKLNDVPLEDFVKNLPLKDLLNTQTMLEGMEQADESTISAS